MNDIFKSCDELKHMPQFMPAPVFQLSGDGEMINEPWLVVGLAG